ncbi:MAG: hypothetical protein AABX23_04330 [Nanoarchaeota archaeon]
MRKHRLVAQEEGMGCGLACVASELGITYQEARKLSGRLEKSYTSGYSCLDLVKALNKNGINYTFKRVAPARDKAILGREGTIAFSRRSRKYPEGHWLLKTSNGWMNPWINWPSINPAQAGYQREFPGYAEWMVYQELT